MTTTPLTPEQSERMRLAEEWCGQRGKDSATAGIIANSMCRLLREADREIANLRAELEATRRAAKRGMDAAIAGSSSRLRTAIAIEASTRPELVESERDANARLTDEIEQLHAELARCKARIDSAPMVHVTGNAIRGFLSAHDLAKVAGKVVALVGVDAAMAEGS